MTEDERERAVVVELFGNHIQELSQALIIRQMPGEVGPEAADKCYDAAFQIFTRATKDIDLLRSARKKEGVN